MTEATLETLLASMRAEGKAFGKKVRREQRLPRAAQFSPRLESKESRGWISPEWAEWSYEIRLVRTVEFRQLMRMKTDAQYIQNCGPERIIYVPKGLLRESTHFIEGKDCLGIPFGWNKTLVMEVVAQDGSLLWIHQSPA